MIMFSRKTLTLMGLKLEMQMILCVTDCVTVITNNIYGCIKKAKGQKGQKGPQKGQKIDPAPARVYPAPARVYPARPAPFRYTDRFII